VLHVEEGFPLTIGDDCTIGHKAMLMDAPSARTRSLECAQRFWTEPVSATTVSSGRMR
jgi:hypothetical protein